MAPILLDKIVHPDTREETEKILIKLRTRKLNCRPKVQFPINELHNDSKNVGCPPGTQHIPQVTYGRPPRSPPGSWWGVRLDLSRDLVHRPLDSDVDLGPRGAASLCTPHIPNPGDIDQGDLLTLTSPNCTDSTPQTHPLALNCQHQLPIRLIRSHNLSNEFAPKTGYRYDGLYIVISSWLVGTPNSKHLRFALAKVDEDPLQTSEVILNEKKTRNQGKTVGSTRNSTRVARRYVNPGKSDLLKSSKEVLGSTSSKTPQLTIPEPCQEDPKLPQKEYKSSIVMRHVSKKCEPIPGIESPRVSHSPKATCKLQNTNISIRTDLYDSYNSQDTKKTPMTFCRVYKSKPQTTGVLNLKSFAPGAQERSQESQIQMRSGKTHSPEADADYLAAKKFAKNAENSSRSCASPEESILKKHKIPSSVVSMESMSPGQMVDLIVHQRHRTAGKLLIGRIIEHPELLTPEVPEAPEIPGRSNILEVPEVTDELPEKVQKPSKLDKKSPRRTLYALRSSLAEKKREKPTEKSSPRKALKQSKPQESLKPSKILSKSAKKRQNELAKLAIDANFVAKIRGPRTRRFPYAMRGFSKRRDTLRHLKGRAKPDLSKKTNLRKRSSQPEVKPIRNRRHAKPQKPSPIDKSDKSLSREQDTIPQFEKKKKLEPQGSEVKTMEKGTQKRESKKEKMVHVGIQCSIQDSTNRESDSNRRRVSRRWEVDVKTEEEDSDDLEEIIYRDNSVQTQGILRKGFLGFSGPVSAFVPVHVSDGDFRVARLRAIGFKPIHPCRDEEEIYPEKDVEEKFRKYTSEETDVVEYMDDELRFEDIEGERTVCKMVLGRGKRGEKGVKIGRKRKERREEWLDWKKLARVN